QCHLAKDADMQQKMKWEELDGAAIVRQTFGVVIHGVPKEHIDPRAQSQNEISAILEEGNDIKVARTFPLMKKARNPTAPTHSIIVFMESAECADRAICDGLCIQGRRHAVEEYAPQCQI